MFQQQPPPPSQQAQIQQQRREQQQFVSAEAQAKEKLSHYVYEYLVHLGAAKTADMFKNEVLAHSGAGNSNIQIDLSAGPPGFLNNWFSVFWDLYSTHPDKKDKAEPSNDAKVYHKMMFPACGFPEGLPNGGIYGPSGFPHPGMNPLAGPPQPQNMPDGLFPGSGAAYFNGPRVGPGPQPGSSQSNQASPIPGGPNRYAQQGTRSGAPTPSNVAVNAMNDQMRMVLTQQQKQQMAQQQSRMSMNLPPAGHQGRPSIRPQFSNHYMDSPSGTPPFSNQSVHNGGGGGNMINAAPLMSPSSNAPVPIPMGNSNAAVQQVAENNVGGLGPQDTPRFMMMSGGAGSAPVGVQQQFMNHHEGPGSTGTPATGPGSSSGGNAAGAGSAELAGDLNNGGGAGPSTQLHSLLNGTGEIPGEMKQSPAFSSGAGSAGGMNGATPLGQAAGGNSGGAGPASVHSQSGASNSQQQGSQQAEGMDIGGSLGNHQSDEISKIKASLMEGFRNFD